ncbi:DUF4430 domain-containing protein [Haloimpatiens sp. FM7330]|uniref:DUF4430 domain-containing protein n=1 Tax=Haloimpatiens sp. FM7330 TaxID=3298610 RepID=UPI0036366F5B
MFKKICSFAVSFLMIFSLISSGISGGQKVYAEENKKTDASVKVDKSKKNVSNENKDKDINKITKDVNKKEDKEIKKEDKTSVNKEDKEVKEEDKTSVDKQENEETKKEDKINVDNEKDVEQKLNNEENKEEQEKLNADAVNKNEEDEKSVEAEELMKALQNANNEITSIKINEVTGNIKVGNKIELTVQDQNNKIIPNENLVFSVNDEKVGRMDEKLPNKFITLSSGTAVITAALKDKPEVKDTLKIDIKENTKHVSIRIEGYDHTILPTKEIDVPLYDISEDLGGASGSSATHSNGWDVSKFDNPTNAHAIVYALTHICKMHQQQEGESDGPNVFDFQDYGWSLYIAMIGGDREHDHQGMSGWMYNVNGSLPPVGCNGKPLEDGDNIVWYYGAYGFDNVFTRMESDKKVVRRGGKVNITLNGIQTTGCSGSDEVDKYDEVKTPVENAVILVNGEEYKVNDNVVKTDKNGKAVLKFNRKGKYVISAVRYRDNKIDIVRPEPIEITVR